MWAVSREDWQISLTLRPGRYPWPCCPVQHMGVGGRGVVMFSNCYLHPLPVRVSIDTREFILHRFWITDRLDNFWRRALSLLLSFCPLDNCLLTAGTPRKIFIIIYNSRRGHNTILHTHLAWGVWLENKRHQDLCVHVIALRTCCIA